MQWTYGCDDGIFLRNEGVCIEMVKRKKNGWFVITILIAALLCGCAGAEGKLSDGSLQNSLPAESTDVTMEETVSVLADSEGQAVGTAAEYDVLLHTPLEESCRRP